MAYATGRGRPRLRYKGRAKFGGMEPTDAKRLRGLEAENAKLKKLLAEAICPIPMAGETASHRPFDYSRSWPVAHDAIRSAAVSANDRS